MSKINQRFFIIVDYNLTRIDDVMGMVRYAQDKYNLKTILIRQNATSVDLSITDLVIDLDPRSKNFVDDAIRALLPYSGNLVGGIVFSDNAVYSGAMLLEKLGLNVDSSIQAEASFSKIKYRQIEGNFRCLLESQNIFVPKYKIVNSIESLKEFSETCKDGFVLKPACEGNNRGVMILNSNDDLMTALLNVESYIADGVICEELIPFRNEYSYDGLAHLSFITKKLSATGKYPVEYGQIIYPKLRHEAVRRAGRLANLFTGQLNGPFHNEIKVSSDYQMAAIIEPNRRPAGMRIWSLAEKVFDLNFYHLWLDKVIANTLPEELPNSSKIAAIRMLGSPRNGYLDFSALMQRDCQLLKVRLFESLRRKLVDFNKIEFFDFRVHKVTGDHVFYIPRDNSDFIAQISLIIDDQIMDVEAVMECVNQTWLNIIDDYIAQCKEVAA